MALGKKKKAQQRRRSKIKIEQICCLLAQQIANIFGVDPDVIMFPGYEGQKIKKRGLTSLLEIFKIEIR